MEYKLVAPDIDRLLNCFDGRYENPSAQPRAVLAALDRLFDVLGDLAPLETNDEAKSIWLRIPRGNIDDFDSYEDLVNEGEVSSREEYLALWEREYPDDYVWYRLVVVDNERCRAVSVNRASVVCADLEKKPLEVSWSSNYMVDLLNLLALAARESMRALREGIYNALVAEQLPYFHRTGVIARDVLWECDQAGRDAVFKGIDEATYNAFCAYAEMDAEDERAIGRLPVLTGNDFLSACAPGYEACGYGLCGKDGKRLPLDELYLRYADGRDEGLTGKGAGLHSGSGIDLTSPEAWEAWYFDRKRRGGHPWEVCRGGNSTHVSLVVCHDRFNLAFRRRAGELSDDEIQEAKRAWGYYYVVAGKAWSRAAEAVDFYIALKRAGLPVVLRDARAILARFKGEDLVGIVPHGVIPVYCEGMFPKRLGTILDFMHVYDEDMANFGDKIEWLPQPDARLASEPIVR